MILLHNSTTYRDLAKEKCMTLTNDVDAPILHLSRQASHIIWEGQMMNPYFGLGPMG